MTVVNINWCDKGVAMQHDWSDGPICKSCGGALPDADTQFAQRLEGLLNAHSQENASNTPDFILAQYLIACLAAWNTGVQQRENWYGRDPRPASIASPGTAPQGWQPIETAPQGEKRVMLFNPDESMGDWAFQTGAYYEQLGGWQYDGQSVAYSNAHEPTHWQPLPSPPPEPTTGGTK